MIIQLGWYNEINILNYASLIFTTTLNRMLLVLPNAPSLDIDKQQDWNLHTRSTQLSSHPPSLIHYYFFIAFMHVIQHLPLSSDSSNTWNLNTPAVLRLWKDMISISFYMLHPQDNNFFIFLASSSILLFVAQNNVHDLYLKCTTHVSTRQLWVSTLQWIDSLKVILLVEIGNLKTRNIIKIENLCKGNILPK